MPIHQFGAIAIPIYIEQVQVCSRRKSIETTDQVKVISLDEPNYLKCL
jgi:hypothetical protein